MMFAKFKPANSGFRNFPAGFSDSLFTYIREGFELWMSSFSIFIQRFRQLNTDELTVAIIFTIQQHGSVSSGCTSSKKIQYDRIRIEQDLKKVFDNIRIFWKIK